jgi:hypothetical protein
VTDIVLRVSGLPLMAGAVLLGVAIIGISTNPVVNQSFSPLVSTLLMIASVLLLVSLPGLYARQATAAGWLGLAGYALLQVGIVLIVVIAATPLLYPSLKQPAGENPLVFLLGIALTFGLLLTGVATIQAGVFPRWAGILILAAMAGFFFVFFVAEFLPPITGQVGSAVFGVLLALGLAWIGLSLFMMH